MNQMLTYYNYAITSQITFSCVDHFCICQLSQFITNKLEKTSHIREKLYKSLISSTIMTFYGVNKIALLLS